jgi:carbonic anhydrase
MPVNIPADDALRRLQDGNRRFATDTRNADNLSSLTRRALMVGQQPFAIILGCSDSRVPAEIIFDQGLGDLFVIRVGGNIVAPSQIGSVEFAADQFGTRLVVVLGHSQCGVVTATLKELEGLLKTDLVHDPDALLREAVRANVRVSANQLRHGSEVLERLIDRDGLHVVGAEYSLESGLVDFFDGVYGS